jgi:MFS family permease
VNGVTATDSGLLLVPLMLGVICASVIAGQVVTRTGRYRVFPILGTALITIGIALLGNLDGASNRLESGVDMAVVGIGIGLTMQVIVIATQNEVPKDDLGIATSAVNFFRTIGGSIGVAALGAILTSRLTTSATGIAGSTGPLEPAHVQRLAPDARTTYVDAFADAMAGAFRYLVPIVAIAIALAVAVRETPLRDKTHAEAHSFID